MKIRIKLLVVILTLCSSIISHGQSNKIDSLFTILKTAKNDTTRVIAYVSLCDAYKNSNSDTALYFVTLGLNLAKKENYKKGIINCFNNIGIVYYYKGDYSKAIENYLKSLKLLQSSSNVTSKENNLIANVYKNIGEVYREQGNYPKATEYYFKSLKIDEKLGDKKGMAACYNNIGAVEYNQGDYPKAIEYFLKSLIIEDELGNKNGMSPCYNNIGGVYYKQQNYPKAIEYFLKSLKIEEEFGNKKGMSRCYNNIGNIYGEEGKYKKAIEYFLNSLKIKEELGDKIGIALVWGNIASLQIILADSTALSANQRSNYLNKAVEYGTKAIKLAHEIKAMPFEKDAANTLMDAYFKLGNFKKAMEYAKIVISTNDSMFNEEKTNALAEMGAKYEAEKKQLEIEKMQKQKELDNKTMEAQIAENRKQQIIIFSAVGGFLIVLIFSIIILRMFRQKRKANILLATQYEEIRQQKEEISAQRDEISAQRDTVVIQKDHIEEQKKEITDSINYAKRIQQAVLPSGEYANKILGNHFILFKPKDIVSGDFYWGTRVNEFLIVTVSDCTGHGVPGAFMSMLGVSFLNEIVRKKEITKASEVLDHLRESIIEALQQKGTLGEQKDGMDIALCVLNTANNQLQFAGANNPLYVISSVILNDSEESNIDSSHTRNDNRELIEIKGDKMPVAIYENMKPYTNHQIQLNEGDSIFLTSDGYEDQFGGPKNKKFMAKQLKELFVNIADKPMNEQQEILNKTFENWRGEHEQIDDVTILGLKI